MKIEFNEIQKTIIVTDKNGSEIVISCILGSHQNTISKANGGFEVANKVLEELGKIINDAKQSV